MKTGMMNFGPKTIEIRFHLSAAQAAVQAGVITVPGAILGSVYGGIHVRLFKLTGRGIVAFTTVTSVLALIFFAFASLQACLVLSMFQIFNKDQIFQKIFNILELITANGKPNFKSRSTGGWRQ